VGRSEKRLGGWRSPVDQQYSAVLVNEAEPTNVDGFRIVRSHHSSETQVETKPAQRAQSRSQAVNLEVAFERLLAAPTGRPPFFVEPGGQLPHSARKAPLHDIEVRGVIGYQFRCRLGFESFWKVENTGCNSHDRRFSRAEGVLRQAPHCRIS
jgi:hypothetical protein